jgi:CHAD domain-containing protein
VRAGRREALNSDNPETRHDWRTGVRRLANQLRLIRGVWPEIVQPQAQALREVAAGLGTDHDLSLLAHRLRDAAASTDHPASVLAIARLADRAARETVHAVRNPARRALAEKPGVFIDRIGGLWRVWRGD